MRKGKFNLWHRENSLNKLTQAGEDVRRLPARLDDGDEGIKQDLVELGIFQVKRDGRIDMPDIYRIGYGLSRIGGIKPVR